MILNIFFLLDHCCNISFCLCSAGAKNFVERWLSSLPNWLFIHSSMASLSLAFLCLVFVNISMKTWTPENIQKKKKIKSWGAVDRDSNVKVLLQCNKSHENERLLPRADNLKLNRRIVKINIDLLALGCLIYLYIMAVYLICVIVWLRFFCTYMKAETFEMNSNENMHFFCI